MTMSNIYFENNKDVKNHAKEILRRILLYTGVDDIDEFNTNRCMKEMENLLMYAEKLRDAYWDRLKPRQVVEVVAEIKPKGIYLEPLKNHNEKPIEELFSEYKEMHGLTDDDFGFNSHRPRGKKFVYNKAMFSRYACGNGYKYTEVSRLFQQDRTTILHYLYRYKDLSYDNE